MPAETTVKYGQTETPLQVTFTNGADLDGATNVLWHFQRLLGDDEMALADVFTLPGSAPAPDQAIHDWLDADWANFQPGALYRAYVTADTADNKKAVEPSKDYILLRIQESF